MTKKIVAVDKPFLQDFDGSDAMLQSADDMKDRCVTFASQAMPEVLRKMLFIVQNSKNEKAVIEASKVIKLISDGQVKGKPVINAVKKYSNEDLAEVLSGVEADDPD